MAATGWEEQLVALAESVKGEETWAPLPGLLTVTPANAGADRRANSVQPREVFRKTFIEMSTLRVDLVVQTGLKKGAVLPSASARRRGPGNLALGEAGRSCLPCCHRASSQGKISVSY